METSTASPPPTGELVEKSLEKELSSVSSPVSTSFPWRTCGERMESTGELEILVGMVKACRFFLCVPSQSPNVMLELEGKWDGRHCSQKAS